MAAVIWPERNVIENKLQNYMNIYSCCITTWSEMRVEAVESWNEAVKCSGYVLLSEIKIEVRNFSVRLLLPAVS